jgi:hypothetical protein
MVLLGIVSVLFQHKSIVAVSDFSIMPVGKGWVAWFWSVSAIILIFTFLSSTLNGFFHFGLILGTLRMLAELLTAIITGAALYFTGFVFTIVAILGVIAYLFLLGFSSSPNFQMPDLTDFYARWRKYEAKRNEFVQQQLKNERKFWKRQGK